ncbi:MAG: 50S ribosomal protein L4 [Ruminococcaceae bacterium]|nr:50S ribosomal protein L4 [Oscillospiraceae bacterium]
MPNVAIYDMAGKEKGSIELSAEVFGAEVNEAVLHSVVRAYLLNQRQGTQSTLTRAEVSGGGIKPWKQKGTGRARQGSTRSPQWTHGGIAFGPKPRSWRVSINKKVKRIAIQSALSSKVNAGELVVVDKIATAEYKTKNIVNMLAALGADKKALIVLPTVDEKVIKSASNIPGVKTAIPGTINVYDILKYEKLIVDEAAIKVIEEVYAK